MNTRNTFSRIALVTLALCIMLGSFGCARTATRMTAVHQFMASNPCPPGLLNARISRTSLDGSARVSVRGCMQRQTYVCRRTAGGTIDCQPEGGAPMSIATAFPPPPPFRRR